MAAAQLIVGSYVPVPRLEGMHEVCPSLDIHVSSAAPTAQIYIFSLAACSFMLPLPA